MALHLPFACGNMRKDLEKSVIATDATPTSGGAVSAVVPERLAEELWRRSELKGEAVRLDREQDFGLWEPVPKEPSRFASMVGECLEWKIEASYHFRQTSHINLQEGRALKRELKRISSRSRFNGCVVLCLSSTES